MTAAADRPDVAGQLARPARDRLADAIPEWCGLVPEEQGWLADALLAPDGAVTELIAEAVAEALETYAADLDRVVHTSDWSVRIPMAGGLDSVAEALRRRAAAVRAAAAPEEGR